MSGLNIDWGLLQTPDIVGNYLKGQQVGNQLAVQRAQLGMAQRQMQGQQQAASALQANDYQGARNALIGTGQFEPAQAVMHMSDEDVARTRQASDDLYTAAQSLKSIPAPNGDLSARQAAAQQMMPALIARNPHINPQMLQGVDLSDHGLDMASQQVLGIKNYTEMHKPVQVNQGAGVTAFVDPYTGQVTNTLRGAFELKPGVQWKAPPGFGTVPGQGNALGAQAGAAPVASPAASGNNLVGAGAAVISNGLTGAPDAPAAGNAMAPSVMQPGDVSANAPPPAPPVGSPPMDNAPLPGNRGTAHDPRGIRNNNPLNLEASVPWQGMTGTDGRYAQFGTMADGLHAADQNLQAYAQRHGLNTVAGIVNRWAPQAENGAATGNYVATVSRLMGVQPNQPLDMTNPAVRQKLALSMAQFENGRPVSAQSPNALASAAPANGNAMNGGSGSNTMQGGSGAPAGPDPFAGYSTISAGPLFTTRANGVRVNNATGETQAPIMGHASTREELLAQHMNPDTPGAFTEPNGKIDVNSTATDQMIVASYDPGTIDNIAHMAVANGGKVPPMASRGRASAMLMPVIQNRINEIRMEEGLTPEGLVRQGITLNADAAAYKQLTDRQASVTTYEEGAKKAGAYVLQAAAGFGGTQFPLLNKALMTGRQQTGDARVDVAVSRLGTYLDEYAKVIGGGTGSAAVTVSVRAAAMDRLSKAATPQAFQAVIQSMNQEMDFRSQSLSDGLAKIADRIETQHGTVPGAAAKAGAQPNLWAQGTAQQRQAALQFKGVKAQPGTAQNPLVDLPSHPVEKMAPGTVYIGRDGAIAKAPPSQAVSMLKANPGMKAAFDQKYGAGSAARFGIR